MHNIVILGAGNIGLVITQLLIATKKYKVILVDKSFNSVVDKLDHLDAVELVRKDISCENELRSLLKVNIDAVVSCLPYFLNPLVAKLVRECNIHYFDLTEDVMVAKAVQEISKHATKAFIPQCGLAPGFIGIAAHNLAADFTTIETIKARVGALPVTPSNVLQYALTWSTDGLINEYGNPCLAIVNGRLVELQPLEGLESVVIDGTVYECFNTAGGLGTLTETYYGRVQNLTYKTIRYPNHCNIMRLLMNDLKLNDHRDILKTIIEAAIPRTLQDVVIIYVTVIGQKDGFRVEHSYLKKIYSKQIKNQKYTAIQVTTAAGLCAVMDKVLEHPGCYQGFIKQEEFNMEDILASPFGFCYE